MFDRHQPGSHSERPRRRRPLLLLPPLQLPLRLKDLIEKRLKRVACRHF